MCASDRPFLSGRERGFSIVEVLVGMAIALIIGIAATGSAKVFTASQRQGIGIGAMSANVGTALAAIKSDVASAGLGFFGNATAAHSNFLCYTMDFSVGTTMKFNGTNFAPVSVTTQGASDQLDAIFSSNIDGGANVLVSAADPTSATLLSLLPASVGQAVLLAPKTAGSACLIRTVTGVTPSTDAAKQALTFANTGSYNQMAFATTPSFAERDDIALLGTLHWSRYRVSGTNLLLERPLDGTSATLLRNVLAFRVQYGITATTSTSTLSGWQDASGATFGAVNGDSVNRISALRIAIVTRSPQREKENASGVCEASAAKPTLPFSPVVTVEPDVTDWRCYRYRTVVAVVPLRNLAW